MLIARFQSDQKKRNYANRCEDRRHKLLDYPYEDIITSRPPVLEAPDDRSVIPRTIVQTYLSENLSRPMHSAVTRWQETNPEYSYQFISNDEGRQFIRDQYPSDYLRAYDRLRPGAFRADLWRYSYLAKYGGVYCDIRMVPICAIRTILDSQLEPPLRFVCARDRNGKTRDGRDYLLNSFIAAVPEHPFVVAALERAVQNVLNGDYGRDDLDITGPGCLGAAANQVLGRDIGAIFDLGDHDDEHVGRYRVLEHDTDNYHRNTLTHQGKPLIVTKCVHGEMRNADKRFNQRTYAHYYREREIFLDDAEGRS
jgi:hypothetical protein